MDFRAFLYHLKTGTHLFHSKTLSDFGRSIRASARGLWRGEFEFFGFVDSMNATILTGYEQAWREGAAACNILPQDRTLEEQQVLDEFINIAQSRIIPLGQFIQENDRESGGAWGTVVGRLDVWINRYREVRGRAQALSCQDIKEEWVWNPAKDHCVDCGRVNGRVYRASIWNKYGWFTQSPELACGGWRCGCRRVPTTKPVTPGRPPSLSGG